VRVIDVFVDELDLNEVGFEGMAPELTGRLRIPSGREVGTALMFKGPLSTRRAQLKQS
jgi:hypothetical protein